MSNRIMKSASHLLLGLFLLCSRSTFAQTRPDPFIWLEQRDSPAALEWARLRTERTVNQVMRLPLYDSVVSELNRFSGGGGVPNLTIRGEYVDFINRSRAWLRAPLASFLTSPPQFQLVLDVQALGRTEGVNWVLDNVSCLAPEFTKCILGLARGGTDRHVLREFDVQRKAFVPDGFSIGDERIHHVRWLDTSSVLIGSDFTRRGNPRDVRLWRRGAPLGNAAIVFDGDPSVAGVNSGETGGEIVMRERVLPYDIQLYLLRGEKAIALDLPLLTRRPRQPGHSLFVFKGQLVVQPAVEWTVGGRSYPAGAILAIELQAFLAGKRNFSVVVAPSERSALYELSTSRDALIVEVLRNLRSEIHEYRFANGQWRGSRVPLPESGELRVVAADQSSSVYFIARTHALEPSTLYARVEGTDVQRVRSEPAAFDTRNFMVEQLETTSKDGTKIPYFVIRAPDIAYDGTNPTLLTGYGAYGIAQFPAFQGSVSPWLRRGGVHVIANIRGGGEFGPAWHHAGIAAGHQNRIDDFIAVAEDLVRRRITIPRRLAIRGVSSGGQLVGATLNQRPDLFGAAVAEVPVFDMKRFHHMGLDRFDEWGNPDTKDWPAFMSKYSPYHNVSSAKYPPFLIVSRQNDDRVGVGHGRKMTALMEERGHEVLYYEATAGAHGAQNAQQATTENALVLTFLLQRLRKL